MAVAVTPHSIQFAFKNNRLDVQTAGNQYTIYEDLDQESLVHEGAGPIKVVRCKLNTLTTNGDVEICESTVRKTVDAAGNVFCRDCESLGIVKSKKAICDWNCESADLLDGTQVYTVGEVLAAVKTPDGHAFISPGFKAKNGCGPTHADLIFKAFINADPDDSKEQEKEASVEQEAVATEIDLTSLGLQLAEEHEADD
ncbi:MAG: hypothetical protein K1X28_06990 [Parachlamydiales bacterium]|nr:hypothetical protein [Parachlamydiales bacterium]